MTELMIDLTDREREQLAAILDIDDASNLDEFLEPYLRAASEEYLRMFLGQRVFTRGSDMREYRLLLLIRHAFGGEIPGEAEVSRLFQTTENQSRSLIRSVISKYQYELSDEISRTLRGLLDGAQPADEEETGGDQYIVVDSDNMVGEFNRRIQAIDGRLPQVKKKRGTASTYVIRASAYEALDESLAQTQEEPTDGPD